MSGIIQLKSTPSGITSPSAGSVFMGVDDSGVFFTKDESGTVTVYPTEGGIFTGGTVSSLSATTLSSTILNVGPSELLGFSSIDNLSLSGDPAFQAIISGSSIGTFLDNPSNDLQIFDGVIDGILDIGGGFAQVGYNGKLTQLLDTSNSDYINLEVGKYVYPAELGGGITKFARIGGIILDTDLEVIKELGIRVNSESGNLEMDLYRSVGDESVYMSFNSTGTDIKIGNDYADDTASIFKVADNHDNDLFQVTNSGVFASTLNIDFTDNLQFKTDSTFESISLNPINNTKFIGEYIGLEETDSISGYTGSGYAGMGVGVFDLGNGFVQTEYVGSLNGFALDDNTASTFKIMGLQDLTAFGQGVSLQNVEESSFSGSSGTIELYKRKRIYLDDEQAEMNIGLKTSDTNQNPISEFYLDFKSKPGVLSEMLFGKLNSGDEFIELTLNEVGTGFEIQNALSDDSASLFSITNNSNNNMFEVRNDGVFLSNLPVSDPLLAGQLWLDGTTVKVSTGI